MLSGSLLYLASVMFRHSIVCFALATLSLRCQAGTPGAAPSLCGPGAEHALFECRSGKKHIAVCAARGWETSQALVQYRFGTPEQVELRIPDAAGPSSAASPKLGLITWSGGGGAHLRFEAGAFSYTVYSATSARMGDKAGVVVRKGARQVAHLPCDRSGPQPDLDAEALSRAGLPQDAEVFTPPR